MREIKQREIEKHADPDEERPEYEAYWDSEHMEALRSEGPMWAFESRIFSAVSNGRVLVLGCGRGERVGWIESKRLDASVCGVEISRAQLSPTARGEFVIGDAEKLPFASSTFETVVAGAVLHHLPNWKDAGIAEIKRVLEDSGTLVFSEPGAYNPPAVIRRRFFPSKSHMPDEHPFDPSEFRDVLERQFTSVKIESHCLVSNALPVVDNFVPVLIPNRLTLSLYHLEKNLPLREKLAWIMTGSATV